MFFFCFFPESFYRFELKQADRQSTYVPIRDGTWGQRSVTSNRDGDTQTPAWLAMYVRAAADEPGDTGGGRQDKTQANLTHYVSLMNTER